MNSFEHSAVCPTANESHHFVLLHANFARIWIHPGQRPSGTEYPQPKQCQNSENDTWTLASDAYVGLGISMRSKCDEYKS